MRMPFQEQLSAVRKRARVLSHSADRPLLQFSAQSAAAEMVNGERPTPLLIFFAPLFYFK